MARTEERMSVELISVLVAVLAIGAALAGLILTSSRGLRQDIKDLRGEVGRVEESMILLRFNFLAGETFARLESLKALTEHTANSIPEMERQAQKALKSRAKSGGWGFDDYCFEQQALEHNYGHWVPRYTGYSTLVLLYSIVETQLLACADRVAEDKSFVLRARDIKGSAVEGSVRLIEALTSINAKQDIAWPHLKDFTGSSQYHCSQGRNAWAGRKSSEKIRRSAVAP